MSCSKLTWSNLKADTLSRGRLARKGRVLYSNKQSSPVLILVQLLVISNTDYNVWAKQFIDKQNETLARGQ